MAVKKPFTSWLCGLVSLWSEGVLCNWREREIFSATTNTANTWCSVHLVCPASGEPNTCKSRLTISISFWGHILTVICSGLVSHWSETGTVLSYCEPRLDSLKRRERGASLVANDGSTGKFFYTKSTKKSRPVHSMLMSRHKNNNCSMLNVCLLASVMSLVRLHHSMLVVNCLSLWQVYCPKFVLCNVPCSSNVIVSCNVNCNVRLWYFVTFSTDQNSFPSYVPVFPGLSRIMPGAEISSKVFIPSKNDENPSCDISLNVICFFLLV